MKTLSMFTRRPRLLTAATFGALALGFGAVSVAADTSDAPHIAVSFGDLDVSTPPGAAALYGRIAAAAGKVCAIYDTDSDPLFLRYDSWHKACIHDAIARAVSQIGMRELFAVYHARNHGRH